MGYITEKIEMPAVFCFIHDFDYALLYWISSVEMVKAGELGAIDWEECQEARFFSEDKELHVFDANGEKRAVLVKDDGDDDRNVRKYEIASRFSRYGRILKVVEYLSYDKDGQMKIALTRLSGVE